MSVVSARERKSGEKTVYMKEGRRLLVQSKEEEEDEVKAQIALVLSNAHTPLQG